MREPGRVLHVPPHAAVPVVVVAVHVEHRSRERLAVVGVRVHDVGRRVADVAVVGRRAVVRGGRRHGTEVVDQLVHRDAGEPPALAEVVVAGRLQEDEGEAELAPVQGPGEARAADVRIDDRPVVVDEGLHRLGGRRSEVERERLEVDARGVEVLRAGARRADETEVEVAEGRRAARERIEVEAGGARGILPAPPGVHRGHIRGDRRGVLGEVVGAVGGSRVDDPDLVCRGDLQVGHAVLAHLVRAAPGHRRRCRGGRPGGEAECDGTDQQGEREGTKSAHWCAR